MHAFRTTIITGIPERDFTVAWSRSGLATDRKLVDTGGQEVAAEFTPVGRSHSHSDPYAVRIRVLPGTMPGSYQLVAGDDRMWIQVAPKSAPHKVATLRPDTSALDSAYISLMLANGYDIVFLPGAYYLDEPVILPDAGCRIMGYGAKFYRTNGTSHCFTGGRNATFIGCEFHPYYYLYWSDTTRFGFHFIDCKFARGTIGWPLAEAVFSNCEWHLAGVEDGGPLGLYINCRFRRNEVYHAFKVRGPCEGKLALVDCEWEDTDRGPVFHCNDGSVSDNLIVGPKFRNIQRDQNGNEMVSTEAGNSLHSFNRNLILGARVSNCDGNFGLIWDVPSHDNLYRDFVIDGGGGIWLSGVNDVPCTGNIYEEFELRDTDGIRLGWRDGYGRAHGLGIANNIIRHGAVLGYRNSRMNQGDYQERYYTRQSVIDYIASGDGNQIVNVVNQSGLPWVLPNELPDTQRPGGLTVNRPSHADQ